MRGAHQPSVRQAQQTGLPRLVLQLPPVCQLAALRSKGTLLQTRPAALPEGATSASPVRPADAQERGTAHRRAQIRPRATQALTSVVEVESDGTTAQQATFFYDGVVFDMDGTLTEAHIDFADMRSRTGIPMGDLFTVMESWQDPAQVAKAMGIILDIEAEAAKQVSVKEGLFELLQLLKDSKVRVALVTRNTQASVRAFLDLIGTEWASVFSTILTREFDFVKPDKRLLLHVASEWGVDPSRLLMVGDSLEDVEVGNAAGSATCLVAGGGNEKPGSAPVVPPPGAVPTFSVTGLTQLAQLLSAASARGAAARRRAQNLWLLEQSLLNSPSDSQTPMVGSASGHHPLYLTSTSSYDNSGTLSMHGNDDCMVQGYTDHDGWADDDDVEAEKPLTGSVRLGWPARAAAGEVIGSDGAPPPGLSFLDWLVEHGALQPGACSFPRMGAAAGGLATCAAEQRGDRVLHVCCGQGGLTKMLASQGMRVVGVDVDVRAAQRRGLQAVPFMGAHTSAHPFTQHSLSAARHLDVQQPQYDVLLLCCEGAAGSSDGAPSQSGVVPDTWWSSEALQEMQSVLHHEGRLCAQVSLQPRSQGARRHHAVNPAAIINQINNNGMTVVAWQLVRPHNSKHGQEATQLRLVARYHDGS